MTKRDAKNLNLFQISALALLGFLLFLEPNAFASGETDRAPSVASRTFNAQALDPETVKAITLETLLDERLKKIVEAAGVRPRDFDSASTVHISKRLKPKDAKKPKKENSPAEKPSSRAEADQLDGSSFKDHSLFDADDLIKQFELQKTAERSLAQSSDSNEPNLDAQKDQDEYEYTVDSIYVQAALADSVYEEAHAQVEKAIHQSFDPLIGSNLKVDVNPFSKDHSSAYGKMIEWIASHPNIVMETLLFLGLAGLLILFRLIPSWQSKAALKTAHEEKEELTHNDTTAPSDMANEPPLPEPLPEPQPEAQSEPEQTPEPPVDPLPDHSSEIERLQKDILAFVVSHPNSSEQVITNWVKDQEPSAKISFFMEFLARNGLSTGRVEVRGDQLRSLRDYKKQASQITDSEQLDYFKGAYWDLIASEHFKHESRRNPFQFLGFVEDSVLFAVLRDEKPQVQARVIGSLNEKRAAALISKFPAADKRRLMESFFSESSDASVNLEDVATGLQGKIKTLTLSQGATLAGAEVVVTILSNLDFPSQFTIASGLAALEPQSRGAILQNYFNVALLPLSQDSFLETVFVDRDSNFVKAVLSQFDTNFIERVKASLPPMQRRMLESENLSSVSRGEAMNTLKELNESILQKLREAKLSLEDIFPAPGEKATDSSIHAVGQEHAEAA
jgi:hypothetical protein